MNGSGGNKAGVVLDEFIPNSNVKIALAARLGYSETVFLSDSGKADFKLEYFTPKGEVPLLRSCYYRFFYRSSGSWQTKKIRVHY